ncbi:hypothetical protein C1T17_16315 [Sphingobium sp. SCG-1]|uniref:hypothetical protein n=1 Tax=Sphingobium sp. SCG-1 TaxID=2072936 RepID=UPI000CD6AE33|nr:hypothetical protein [Sphingobium sp. SCG-1]AUW59417.1 hypothetical protein C1T17_16315 [Sphingobium sp. SCG-1]
MRNDPACLRHAVRLHPMACRCQNCRPSAMPGLLSAAKAMLRPAVRNVRQILATPTYDPHRRQFTLLSREPMAAIVIIIPMVLLAIGVFLALEPGA